MNARLQHAAREAIGFMPEDEGLALYEAALMGLKLGPVVEIGSYCGKSTTYLAAAAKEVGGTVYSIDHHRGSEEHQPGQEYFDERFVDSATGRVNTLSTFLGQLRGAGIEDVVVPVVARAETLAPTWSHPLGLLFIDGSHSAAAAHRDYEGWAPHVSSHGLLAIHDVFEDPAAGGRPPYEIYRRALESGTFAQQSLIGSLRVLERIG